MPLKLRTTSTKKSDDHAKVATLIQKYANSMHSQAVQEIIGKEIIILAEV